MGVTCCEWVLNMGVSGCHMSVSGCGCDLWVRVGVGVGGCEWV